MLPQTGTILTQKFEITTQPSKTYQLKDGRIRGHTDGLEAIRQTVFCILNTERFQSLIYSWNYGVELNRVYGKSPGLIQSKIKKRIQEALTQDDRIQSVGAFSFTKNGSVMEVVFTVQTKDGAFETGTEVMLNV